MILAAVGSQGNKLFTAAPIPEDVAPVRPPIKAPVPMFL